MLPLLLFGRLALYAGLAFATWGGAKLAARLFSVPDFHWFDSQPASAAWWRRIAVRVASALGPLALCVALYWCANFFGGEPVPTTTVVVLDGPARDAGMQSGDRVVAVDGSSIEDWETLRRAVRRQGERQIALERNGSPLVLRVTPNAEGRIGVSPRDKIVPLGFIESAARALKQPFAVIRSEMRGVLARGSTELKGPVGIVRETAPNGQRTWTSIVLLFAGIASDFWPSLAALSFFDAATLWLFRKTQRATHPKDPMWRVARLQQGLSLVLLSFVAMIALLAVDELVQGPSMSLPMTFLLLPAFALAPMTWLLGTHFWSLQRTSLIVGGAMLFCLPLVSAILWQRARRKLRERGFRVGWFVVNEPTADTAHGAEGDAG
ncbi:MAG TPA: M50 family metallopeptidase [Polyangiaceae bacterium]|nr:M50 family metallopeptidase [Polyangiaceae bacterium]